MVQSVLLLLGVAVLLVGLVGLYVYLAEDAACPHPGRGILAVRFGHRQSREEGATI